MLPDSTLAALFLLPYAFRAMVADSQTMGQNNPFLQLFLSGICDSSGTGNTYVLLSLFVGIFFILSWPGASFPLFSVFKIHVDNTQPIYR